MPEESRSVEVTRRDAPVYRAPDERSPRRGALALGARFPIYGVAVGPGCSGGWILVGPSAFLCGDDARVVSDAGMPGVPAASSPGSATPLPYYAVGADGAFGYASLSEAGTTRPVAELQPGFFVALVRQARGPTGDPFGLTTKGLWLPVQDLARVSQPELAGHELVEGEPLRGWVVEDGAPVRAAPSGRKTGTRRRFDPIVVLEEREERGKEWVRVGESAWLAAGDLAIPRPASPPAEVDGSERWIDVELATQTLTLYEGKRPVFATLVSTGIGSGDAKTATPPGLHRIWVKLRTTDMTNLEDEEARHHYAIEEVPWVLFFDGGVGIHGAFWHEGFGRRRSHGCVNLSPRDAARVFSWARPALPPGWAAVLPTEYDPGTLVRVR